MLVNYFLRSLLIFILIFSGYARAQSPTAAAGRFNIFVKGDVTLTSNETEGAIAIGGNLISTGHGVNFDRTTYKDKDGMFTVKNATIGLAVRGGVELRSGHITVDGKNYVKIGNCRPTTAPLTDLTVWYKDFNNTDINIKINGSTTSMDSDPKILINAQANTWSPRAGNGPGENPVCENVFGTGENQIDIDNAFTTFISKSAQMAGLKDNVAIRTEQGALVSGAEVGPYRSTSKINTSTVGNNPQIIFDKTKLNVLTVSAEVWNSIQNYNVTGFADGLVRGQSSYTGGFGIIINIVDFPAFVAAKGTSTIKLPTLAGLGESQASFVIYNFVDATGTLKVSGNNQIVGTLFAPQADLYKDNSGNINGQIIAKTYVHKNDEVHFWPFLVPLPVDKTITVAASAKCLKDAPKLDYTVTPSFDASGSTVKIEWLNKDNTVIKTDENQPLSGSILFPGAAVDGSGTGTAWPGWEYSGGKWVQVTDLTSTIRNEGAQVRITLTTTQPQSVGITYPPSTASCFTSPPPPPVTPLPVTLTSFTARNENCKVAVKWKISEAKNFSHFVVQRSKDARTFAPVTTISYDAAVSEYSFVDSPFSTESIPVSTYYYRLQQVDLDQSVEYSAIRNVDAGSCDTRLSVDFYPNPTQTDLNVRSFSPLKKVEVFSTNGKVITQLVPAQGQTEVKLDMSSLTQGLYIVNITNEEGRYSSKILKK